MTQVPPESDQFFKHPILNSPYALPARHWELDEHGQPTQAIIETRRPAEFISPIPKPRNAIRLTEVAPHADKSGKRFLEHLANANREANPDLMRLALKLATGAGKTTVMAMLIAWQTMLDASRFQVLQDHFGEAKGFRRIGLRVDQLVDTDSNEESFFVRHAYFLGANDPYKSLKTTLKAEINEEAWATLNSDTSRPFDKPVSAASP